MLGKLLVRFIFGAVGLWIASKLLEGQIVFTSTESLVISALVLGVVNAFVRPVVTILTFPLTIVTLGFFLLIVNAAMIGLTSMVVPGFHVHGLVAGVLAAIITGVSSWIGGMILQDGQREYRRY
jgi:putative membrane protein